MAFDLDKIAQKIIKSQQSNSPSPLDEEELTEMISTLTRVLSELVLKQEKQEKLEEKVIHLEARSRIQEDVADHHHQRSLLGRFTISPPPLSSSSSESSSIIKQIPELKKEGLSLADHTCDLLYEKFGIRPAPEDIRLCHHTKTGIVFALQNLKHSSTLSSIVGAIKEGMGKVVSTHYINFTNTPKRNSILYELRKFKKANKIWKFYSDYDGEICYVREAPLPGTPKDKTKVTNTDPRGTYRTLSIQELKDSINNNSSSD